MGKQNNLKLKQIKATLKKIIDLDDKFRIRRVITNIDPYDTIYAYQRANSIKYCNDDFGIKIVMKTQLHGKYGWCVKSFCVNNKSVGIKIIKNIYDALDAIV